MSELGTSFKNAVFVEDAAGVKKKVKTEGDVVASGDVALSAPIADVTATTTVQAVLEELAARIKLLGG